MAVVLAVWLLLGRSRAVDEDVTLLLGASAERVREVDLHFQRDGSVVRDVTLTFSTAAPDEVHHRVRLREGSYDVAVRIVYRDGREAHVGRTYLAGRAGAGEPIDLALR